MKNRIIILLLISFIYVSTYGMLNEIDGIFYYPACASVELVTILALRRIKTRLSFHLQIISFALIISHIIGLILYVNFYPPLIYQFLAYFMMTAQIIRIFWVGNNDNTNNNKRGVDSGGTFLRSGRDTGILS